jgi:hypothetical protein
MKIRQVKGIGALAELSRKRLETSTFPSLEHARQQVQQLFPNHRFFKENGVISVEVRDRSFRVAVFREETSDLLHVPMRR